MTGSIRRFVRRLVSALWGASAEPRPQWHTVQAGPVAGAKLFVSCGPRVFRLMVEGRYDEYLVAALDDLGLSLAGQTIWDVGAHIGYDSLVFASLVGPTGTVISFEPNPFNAERLRMHLRHNVELGCRIALYELALWRASGHITLHFSREVDNGRSSVGYVIDRFGKACRPDGALTESAQVACNSIDDLVLRQGLAAPRVIKIDVEGAEGAVLEGAQQVVARFGPVLLIEVHGVAQMFHVLSYLHAWNYEVRLLDTWNASDARCFVVARPLRGSCTTPSFHEHGCT